MSKDATSASAAYLDDSTTWESFNLDPRLLQSIDKLGFENPTLIQSSAIPLALEEKRDIIAKASTGSGKTGAYSIPIIQNILNDSTPDHEIKSIILVPTRELSNQVFQFLEKLLLYCNTNIGVINLSSNLSDQVLQSLLLNKPEILISTPSKLITYLENNNELINLSHVKNLTIDEVDLILSYGYLEDLNKLKNFLPIKKNLQTFLMSATINDDLEEIKSQFCSKPAVLKLNDSEISQNNLLQFYAKTTEFDKFLLSYVIFKLQLIKGKTIIFVNNIERGYRLKLFLEQFGIRSCILNSELPINSRIHIVDEFNMNVYNLLIATDETNTSFEKDEDAVSDEEASNPPQQDQEQQTTEESTIDGSAESKKSLKKKQRNFKKDKEYGVSRGVDFQNVACVLNFDLPTTSRSYIHRVGRTARAGKKGMALSFVIPLKEVGKHKTATYTGAKRDEKILRRIVKQQERGGFEIKPYQFDMKQVEGFRYRAEDAFRAVTSTSVREARIKELKNELVNSDKLKRYFEENPQDLASLRHDKELHPSRIQSHLKRIPDYLLPESARGEVKNLGFVPFTKKVHKKRGKKNSGGGKTDPLKSFKPRN